MNQNVQRPLPALPVGTQVVILREVIGQDGRILHARGAVGVITKSFMELNDSPSDSPNHAHNESHDDCHREIKHESKHNKPIQKDPHCYFVRFLDGVEERFPFSELTTLAKFKGEQIDDSGSIAAKDNLFQFVIFQCIIGSHAYGLDDSTSDTDRRGFYLPPADLHWSLTGLPEQLECYQTQESYWEIQKFLVLALKANPSVLECLYSPLVEKATPLAEELLGMREIFLTKLVYQTYNGYVMSQFKKMQADIRNHGQVKWKQVMHLIRLLISGIHALREGVLPVLVQDHREELLAIKRGEVSWEETEKWRLSLYREFDLAYRQTTLPERPNYEKANAYLVKARRAVVGEKAR